MYKRILVAVEHSAADRTILDHAKAVAHMCGAEVLLVHVADGWAARHMDDLKMRESEEIRDDRAYLAELVAEFGAEHIETTARLACGDPAAELVRVAREEHVDLIAMATHGHRGISDLLHGSTADSVRHALTIPVLLLRSREQPEHPEQPEQHPEGGHVQKWMPIAAVMAALTLAAPLTASADNSAPAFTVGTATAQRGQKAFGAIEVPAGVDAALSIPVAVVHGARPGPVLAIVSGAHGTEYASIIAVERLIAELDPAAVSGTVILIPLVNVPSFEQKVAHVNPVDGKSMNRFYPGRMDGTQTERASFLITKQVVEPSDHVIDLHGGDLDESLRPYSYWTKTGNEGQDRVSREMVLAFGLDHIIISADRPKDPAASRYLENTASTRGKPSLTAEAGYAGTVEPQDVDALVHGCVSVMRYLKMLAGAPAFVESPVWVEQIAGITSDVNGIFTPLVKRGTYVQKGMKIGYVTDYLGRTLQEARAPESGVVLFIRAVPSMTKGETMANIGVVSR